MIRKILMCAMLAAASTTAVAAPPARFLRDAIQGSYSEVVLGRMIQSRGATGQVRNFGSMLVRDHGKALVQAQAIADRMHLRIAATLTPEARHEQTVLRRLSGRSFDREVRRYMIDDHRADIAKFRYQARTGDRATARFATATSPVMRHHLSMAQSIRG